MQLAFNNVTERESDADSEDNFGTPMLLAKFYVMCRTELSLPTFVAASNSFPRSLAEAAPSLV